MESGLDFSHFKGHIKPTQAWNEFYILAHEKYKSFGVLNISKLMGDSVINLNKTGLKRMS